MSSSRPADAGNNRGYRESGRGLIDPFETDTYRRTRNPAVLQGFRHEAMEMEDPRRPDRNPPNVDNNYRRETRRSRRRASHDHQWDRLQKENWDRVQTAANPNHRPENPPKYEWENRDAPKIEQKFVEKHLLREEPIPMTRDEEWEYERTLSKRDQQIRRTYGYPDNISHWKINEREKVKKQYKKQLKTEVKLLNDEEIERLEKAQKRRLYPASEH
ncbi:MAG: hypothetical protein Q9222_002866 [Ikaeria aurantiellina]